MMLTKSQKNEFVIATQKELGQYKTVGIIQLAGIPDRLLQSAKNKLKGRMKLVMGRKSLLTKILEGSPDAKKLAESLDGTCAIVMSNEEPFELFAGFKSNAIKVSAKPKQVATGDVFVAAGETSLQPGQAVTELKQAGIDVQIQKGKVVIGKDKVVVKEGDVIAPAMAKALHSLGIEPFTAVIEPYELLSQGLLFRKALLDIDPARTAEELSLRFNAAVALCMECGIANKYTIKTLVSRAFRSALALGIEAGVYDKGITEHLVEKAARSALSLNNLKGNA